MSIWDYEATVSRRAQRKGGMGWTRRAIFERIPSTIAEALIPPEYSVYPGESGKEASCLVESDCNHDALVSAGGNFARVILYYRPLTYEEWLEQHPNKAVLLGSAGATAERVTHYGDWVIDGQDPDDADGKTHWQVVAGSNILMKPQASVEVYGVTNNITVYYRQLISRVGKYNSTPMDNLSVWPKAARAGQWLFTEMSCVPRFHVRGLYTVRYRFLLNLDLWSNPCISEKFQYQARTIPLKDEYGTEIGTKEIAVLVPMEEYRTANLITGTNLFMINNMLSNSW